MVYDLIIIGGGPGGVGAGVYASRKGIRSLLITKDWGGQSVVSPEIQNWIGTISISGQELARKLKEHVISYAKDILDLDEGSLVTKISKKNSIFEVETDKEKKYKSRAIIIASGGRRRKLEVKGAKEFEGRGVVYCASCDAPLFKDKEVAVIGGGNAGFETAQQLLVYAKKIYILEYEEEFRADEVTREKILADKRVTAITSVRVLEIKGKKFVESLIYNERKTGEIKELKVQGIFVEIGSLANSEFVKELVKLNERGEIIIDHKTCRTSLEGIWAAGDVTDQPYKQNNISVGDAIKALEDAYLWLKK